MKTVGKRRGMRCFLKARLSKDFLVLLVWMVLVFRKRIKNVVERINMCVNIYIYVYINYTCIQNLPKGRANLPPLICKDVAIMGSFH